MKLLLINPNRYHNPPVMPIGLEYLSGAVTAAGHDVEVLDLCFSDKPMDELSKALQILKVAILLELRLIFCIIKLGLFVE